MKKMVSILLSALMIAAAALAFPLSSMAKDEESDPVGISDAAGFAAMETGGSYFLTQDITISATHVAAFSGTFDGKGHKITTSVALFDTFQGVAKDFTIEGAVTGSGDRGGVFCNTITGETTLSGIVNKANLLAPESQAANADELEVTGSFGGIVGTTVKSVPLTIENCENYGKITGYDAGGIIGKSHAALTMRNCKNFGDVSAGDCAGGLMSWPWGDFTIENCVNGSETVTPDITSSGDAPGGIVSYISGNTNGTFKNCVNYGHVHSAEKDAAGIMGRAGKNGRHVYEDCVNYGPVEGAHAAGIAGADGAAVTILRCFNYAEIQGATQAAGIIASLGASGGTKEESTITYSANEGKITANKDTAGGIAAYVNGSSVSRITIKGCYNNGDVTGGCEASGILGYYNGGSDSSAVACFNTGLIYTTNSGEKPLAIFYNKGENADASLTKDNFYLAGCATNESRFKNDYLDMNPTDGDKFAYGEVCYKLNQALGEEVFFQTIGTDAFPTFDASHKRVVFDGQNYSNPADAGGNPSTGDSTMLFAAVAVISLLGAGYVVSRRRRAE